LIAAKPAVAAVTATKTTTSRATVELRTHTPGLEQDPGELERVLRRHLQRQYAEHPDLFELSDDDLASASLPDLLQAIGSEDERRRTIAERRRERSRLGRLRRRIGF
jgi:hypothetical protein